MPVEDYFRGREVTTSFGVDLSCFGPQSVARHLLWGLISQNPSLSLEPHPELHLETGSLSQFNCRLLKLQLGSVRGPHLYRQSQRAGAIYMCCPNPQTVAITGNADSVLVPGSNPKYSFCPFVTRRKEKTQVCLLLVGGEKFSHIPLLLSSLFLCTPAGVNMVSKGQPDGSAAALPEDLDLISSTHMA